MLETLYIFTSGHLKRKDNTIFLRQKKEKEVYTSRKYKGDFCIWRSFF